ALGLALAALIAVNFAARADDEADYKAAFAKAVELQKQAKYSEAAWLYERALVLAPRVYGPDHVTTASVLNSLAGLYRYQGKYAEAEPLHRRAPGHPGEGARPRPPRRGPEPQQPRAPVQGPGQVRGGRAAQPTRPGDLGESSRPRRSGRGHEPQQHGTPV